MRRSLAIAFGLYSFSLHNKDFNTSTSTLDRFLACKRIDLMATYVLEFFNCVYQSTLQNSVIGEVSIIMENGL